MTLWLICDRCSRRFPSHIGIVTMCGICHRGFPHKPVLTTAELREAYEQAHRRLRQRVNA